MRCLTILLYENLREVDIGQVFEDLSRRNEVEPISVLICQVSLGFPAFSDVSSKAAAKVKINFSNAMLFFKKYF
jgi:hypothetical protein